MLGHPETAKKGTYCRSMDGIVGRFLFPWTAGSTLFIFNWEGIIIGLLLAGW